MDKRKILEEAAEILEQVLYADSGKDLTETSAPSLPHEANPPAPKTASKRREYSDGGIIEDLRKYAEDVEWVGSVLEEILEGAYIATESRSAVRELLENDSFLDDNGEEGEDIVGSEEDSEEEVERTIPKNGVHLESELTVDEDDVIEALESKSLLEFVSNKYESLDWLLTELGHTLYESANSHGYASEEDAILLMLMETDGGEEVAEVAPYRNVGKAQMKQLIGHIASVAKHGGKVKDPRIKEFTPARFFTHLKVMLNLLKTGKVMRFWDLAKPIVDIVAHRQRGSGARLRQAYSYAWNRLAALLEELQKNPDRVKDMIEKVWEQNQDIRDRGKSWTYSRTTYLRSPKSAPSQREETSKKKAKKKSSGGRAKKASSK